MKNYMPLDGLRCSRDSGSAHCDTPKSAVLGRPGGVKDGLLLNFAKNKGIVKSEIRINFALYRHIVPKSSCVWYQKMSRILNNGLKR